MQLYLYTYSEHTGGESEDEDDPYSNRSDEHITFEILRASYDRGEEFFPPDSVEIPDDMILATKLYMPVVRYSDGDTFGSTYGKHKYGPVFACMEQAKAWDKETSDYCPWNDYFSDGGTVEYYTFDMMNNGEATRG